jgi:hypothetical protein
MILSHRLPLNSRKRARPTNVILGMGQCPPVEFDVAFQLTSFRHGSGCWYWKAMLFSTNSPNSFNGLLPKTYRQCYLLL